MGLLHFLTKNKVKSEPKIYTVVLQRYDDEYPAYTFTHTPAKSPEDAVESCKKFLAENGWWPWCLSIEERMNRLTAVSVTLNTTP